MDWRLDYYNLPMCSAAGARIQELRAEADHERLVREARSGHSRGTRPHLSLRARLGHVMVSAGAVIAGDLDVRLRPEPFRDLPASDAR